MPPIGDLRFTFPQKITPNGQKYYVGNDEANPYADSTCSQMDFHEIVTGQEDCLHLNIYVPEVETGQYLIPTAVLSENRTLAILWNKMAFLSTSSARRS